MSYVSLLPAILAILFFLAALAFSGRLSPEKRGKLVAFAAGMIAAQILNSIIQSLAR